MSPSDTQPSPFRFLTPKATTSNPESSTGRKRKSVPPRPSARPAPATGSALTSATTTAPASLQQSSSQFAPTRRFNTTKTPSRPSLPLGTSPAAASSSSPLVSRTRPVYRTPAPIRADEAVDENSDEDSDSPLPLSPTRLRRVNGDREDDSDDAEDSEHGFGGIGDDQTESTHIVARSMSSDSELHLPAHKFKRRRLSSSRSPPSESLHNQDQDRDQDQSQHHPRATTTGIIHPPQTSNTTNNTTTPHRVRPRFILPQSPPSNPERSALTPFSPHKPGRKFVEGGFASTVRRWALEAASEAGTREDDYVAVIKVQECRCGSGTLLIRGVQSPGLASEMPVESCFVALPDKGVEDLVGKSVAIRRPWWDLDLAVGESERGVEGKQNRWKVAVDWQVI